ncbi:transposase [Paraburkholderia sp. BL6665CI2N2]|nr:transposase [Paraburkholderia sp. BL6665CI2N2]
MFKPTTNNMEPVEVLTQPEQRRRRSVEEKLAIVRETFEPGATVSGVARRHRVNANQVFARRKLYQDGSLSAVSAGEQAVPASDLAEAMKQIRELQRLLGKKTVEVKILREAVEYGRAKNVWSTPVLQASTGKRSSLRKCIRPLASQPLLAARP